jgi:hypothetical protein
VQWAVTLLLIPVGIGVVAGVIALIGSLTIGHPPWFTFWFGLIYGAPAAIYGAVRLMRGVSFDEPLRHKLTTAREELGRRSRHPAEAPTRWQMPWPRLTELPEPAENLLAAAPSAERGNKEA